MSMSTYQYIKLLVVFFQNQIFLQSLISLLLKNIFTYSTLSDACGAIFSNINNFQVILNYVLIKSSTFKLLNGKPLIHLLTLKSLDVLNVE